MNSLIYIFLSNSHRGCCKRYLRGVWRSCQSEAQLYNLRKFSAATQDYNNHSLKKLQQSYNADACQFIRYCSTDQTSRGMTKTEKLGMYFSKILIIRTIV